MLHFMFYAGTAAGTKARGHTEERAIKGATDFGELQEGVRDYIFDKQSRYSYEDLSSD